MKLYTAHRAPSPRRVLMFLIEKKHHRHRDGQHGPERRRAPHARIFGQKPAGQSACAGAGRRPCDHRDAGDLHLAGGPLPRAQPDGRDGDERGFIEMADRQVELYLLGGIANAIRHSHPGLAALEKPQFPEFGRSQAEKVRDVARGFDQRLQKQPFIAGERFTIADITAFCALEFARGLMKFVPGDEGMPPCKPGATA